MEAIITLLPTGEMNAISRRQLRVLTGLSDRKLRLQIAAERRAGALILSSTESAGYYQPESREELRRFVNSMRSRAASIYDVLGAAESALELWPIDG